jgi:hypothetical protein
MEACPMNRLAALLGLSLLGVGVSYTEVLPDAPRPIQTPHHDVLRDSLLTGVALARVADWTSTEDCLKNPRYTTPPIALPVNKTVTWSSTGCEEKILPMAIAGSKYRLAAFELGMTAGEVYLSGRLAKHHRRLALAMDAASFAATSLTAANNYSKAHRTFKILEVK